MKQSVLLAHVPSATSYLLPPASFLFPTWVSRTGRSSTALSETVAGVVLRPLHSFHTNYEKSRANSKLASDGNHSASHCRFWAWTNTYYWLNRLIICFLLYTWTWKNEQHKDRPPTESVNVRWLNRKGMNKLRCLPRVPLPILLHVCTWKLQVFRHHCKHDQSPFFPYLRIRNKERKNEMLLLVLLETKNKTGG